MIKLPGIFTDHAVIQRDKSFRIWGQTDNAHISVSIHNENDKEILKGEADAAGGKFEILMPKMQAGGPYSIVISGNTSGVDNVNSGTDAKTADEKSSDQIIFSDIYFGEVWLAGGQSNMELELQNSKNGKEAVEESDNPRIRFYYTPKIAWLGEELDKAEEESIWQLCRPGETKYWSAVGYYFAQALTEELEDVMIGIVGCNWGGTSASAWMSREKLLEYKETAPYIERYDELTRGQSEEEYIKEYEDYVVYQAEFDKNVGNYYATNPNPTWDEAISLFGENKYPGPMGPRNWTRPAGLHETMIKRIAPYALRGFIYYQGEDDDNRPYAYERLLTSLVEQWKDDFKDDSLAFIPVQLPIFVNEGETDDKNWPFIREAQAKVGETAENGCAVILETGEFHNIHPLDKETPGYRLAFQALYHVYGTMTRWDACGPVLDGSFADDGAMYVDLACCEGGLVINEDGDFLEDVHMQDYLPEDSGFEIAGADGKYYPAKAQVLRGEEIKPEENSEIAEDYDEEIYSKENYNVDLTDSAMDFEEYSGNQNDLYGDYDQVQNSLGSILTLKLTSKEVPDPKFARYFWKNYGKVRVFGANGIPLAPFRTSDKDGAKAVGTRQGRLYE